MKRWPDCLSCFEPQGMFDDEAYRPGRCRNRDIFVIQNQETGQCLKNGFYLKNQWHAVRFAALVNARVQGVRE